MEEHSTPFLPDIEKDNRSLLERWVNVLRAPTRCAARRPCHRCACRVSCTLTWIPRASRVDDPRVRFAGSSFHQKFSENEIGWIASPGTCVAWAGERSHRFSGRAGRVLPGCRKGSFILRDTPRQGHPMCWAVGGRTGPAGTY